MSNFRLLFKHPIRKYQVTNEVSGQFLGFSQERNQGTLVSVPSHHHAGFIFAYVLSGTVRSQLNDGPAVDYRIGQSWVEPPGTHHSPSETDTASLLAVFVASSGAKLTTIDP